MAEPAVAQPPVVAPPPGDPPAPPPAPPPTELGGAPAGDPPKDPAVVEPPKDPPKDEPKPVVFDAAKLQLPEGMKADDPILGKFNGLFTDDKIDPQARAQGLLDLYKESVQTIRTQQMDAWKTTNDGWVAEVKADPEVGGAKFAVTKSTIAKAIDSLGPELSVAFRQGLDATGAGNHPAIWKGLAKWAATLTEGGHVIGSPPAAGKPTLKEAFYPNSPDMK